jgi:DNA-damage-inducible protein J
MKIMPQTTISIRMDDQLKKQAEWYCNEFGMSLSTAVTVFARAVVRERRIPFEISTNTDPFFSESNMKHLREAIAEFNDPDSPKIVKSMEELEAMAK